MVPLPRGRDAAALATVNPVVKFVWKPARRAVGQPAWLWKALIVPAKSIDRPRPHVQKRGDLLLSQQRCQRFNNVGL